MPSNRKEADLNPCEDQIRERILKDLNDGEIAKVVAYIDANLISEEIAHQVLEKYYRGGFWRRFLG